MGVPSFVVVGGSDNELLMDSYLGGGYSPLMFSQQQGRDLQDMLTIPQARLPVFNQELDLIRALNLSITNIAADR